MPATSPAMSQTAYNPYPLARRPTSRAQSEKAESSRPQTPPAHEPNHTFFKPQRPATPADLHPWGAKFVQFGHTLTQYSARVQVFFEGLVGLSSPNLEAEHHDQAVAAMAQRLFEIRLLSGEAPARATGPMAQDIDNASKFLAQQRTFRSYGDQINSGVHGAVRWCKAWFV